MQKILCNAVLLLILVLQMFQEFFYCWTLIFRLSFTRCLYRSIAVLFPFVVMCLMLSLLMLTTSELNYLPSNGFVLQS